MSKQFHKKSQICKRANPARRVKCIYLIVFLLNICFPRVDYGLPPSLYLLPMPFFVHSLLQNINSLYSSPNKQVFHHVAIAHSSKPHLRRPPHGSNPNRRACGGSDFVTLHSYGCTVTAVWRVLSMYQNPPECFTFFYVPTATVLIWCYLTHSYSVSALHHSFIFIFDFLFFILFFLCHLILDSCTFPDFYFLTQARSQHKI